MQTGTDVPPQREIIGCTDALGRRRAFEVYLNEKGRVPEQIPLFRGHTAAVLDTDWYGRTRHGMQGIRR